jgi:hypothetical protein
MNGYKVGPRDQPIHKGLWQQVLVADCERPFVSSNVRSAQDVDHPEAIDLPSHHCRSSCASRSVCDATIMNTLPKLRAVDPESSTGLLVPTDQFVAPRDLRTRMYHLRTVNHPF